MQFLPGQTYHVYNQGNNKEDIFFRRDDYLLFLKKMKRGLTPHCSILAWCLMPNHFHWLIRVNNDYAIEPQSNKTVTPLNSLNKSIGSLLSSYTQSVNQKNNRTGSLFRKRTKAKSLDETGNDNDHYGINCFLYIHQNPLRAGLVNKLGEWEFSSYQDYADLRSGTLCNKELTTDLFDLPTEPQKFQEISIRTIPDRVLQNFY